ncbi:SLC13 family permease [Thermogladius sp.]|uniref:SLC13 family permease n=1 Tax=Thermogladius sp. TaxID=2023064 RepID=UPI003D148725
MKEVNVKLAAGGLIVVLLMVSLVIRGKRPKTPIWSIMTFTAFIAVASGLVRLDELNSVIDLSVVLFLIGMFSITGLAERSGLLDYVASRFIRLFKTRRSLIVASSLLFGLLSAVAVNDTVALMGPPIAYTISKAIGVDSEMMMLLLAFSLTIGSVMTPIGNPQNMLIAVRSGMSAPFVKFVLYLSIPTALNLLVTPLILMKLYGVRNGRKIEVLLVPEETIKSRRDAALAGIGLAVSVSALVVNDLLQLMGLPYVEERGIIPFVVASAIYVFSENPREVLSKVDWGTIVFFISMFITMEGVWRSGFLNPLLALFVSGKPVDTPLSILSISALSVVGSQLISNVPFTRLMITELHEAGYTGKQDLPWLTLAMSTTIAGNLTILGAASNIIIVEYLESRMGTTITFTKFAKIGAIVTLVNIVVYFAFLAPLQLLGLVS